MKSFLLALLMFAPVSVVYAQADGSADTAVSSDPQTKVDAGTPVPTPAEPGSADPAAPAGGGVSGEPQPTSTSTPSGQSSGSSAGSLAPEPAISEPTVVSVGSADVPLVESTSAPTSPAALVAAVALALVAILGISFLLSARGKRKPETHENTCDSIKELLEQKKKELEAFVRSYPEEKIKELAKNAVLTEIRKDKGAQVVLDAVDTVQDAYNKLQRAIDILQMRYDLCTLSLPGISRTTYRGTIIENSLKDAKILEQVKIQKHYEAGDWKIKDVEVNEKQIEKFGATLSDGPWYMHFWQENKDDGIVVFKDKNFNVKYSDRSTWKDAVAHGKALGIPDEQLDFVVKE